MKQIIEHLQKLIVCDKIIFTGSFALEQMGLTGKVKDLDVLLFNPSSDTILVLNRLHQPYGVPNYPDNPNQFRIIINNISVDLFITDKVENHLDICWEGMQLSISKVDGIINAKKSYNRLKDVLQLKSISEVFYKPEDLKNFINSEQKKY